MAEVGRLGPKVGSHLELFCIHRMNWITLAMTPSHDESTVNIVLVLVLLLSVVLLFPNLLYRYFLIT